jgi:NHS family nucleoside permease-like MFS transporter
VFRFGFFAVGSPAMPGVLLFILSMVVYGVAFDFFNVSGSLFVDKETPENLRSSAQGLFMLMTNGLGASIGVIVAQKVVDNFTHSVMLIEDGKKVFYTVGDWSSAWYIFAGYALVIAVLFAVVFKDKKATKA